MRPQTALSNHPLAAKVELFQPAISEANREAAAVQGGIIESEAEPGRFL